MVLKPAQHRPLVGLALVSVAGALLGQILPQGLWAYAAAAVCAVVFWGLRGRRIGTALLVAALFAASFRGASAAFRERAWRESLLELQGNRTNLSLTGTVETEPDGAVLPHGGARLSFRLRVTSASSSDGTPVPSGLLPMPLDVDFYVPVSYLGESPSRAVPRAGEGWIFTGQIRSREVPYQTEPLFSLRVTVDELHRRVAKADAPAWRQRLWELRRETARRLSLGIEDRRQAVAILRAVLLGYRSDIPPDVRDLFANSGTVHLFAISGLHIMLIAKLLLLVQRRLGVPHRLQGLLLVPALVAYTVLTGGRPSAERACIMASIHYSAAMFRRRPDAISSVAAAAVVILLKDPAQVMDLGFVFSFSSVLGILLLSTPLARLLEMCLRRRRAAPEEEAAALEARMEAARPSGAGRVREGVARFLRKLRGGAIRSLTTSLAAWAVAEPITARVFGQMVPVSVVSNLFVILLGQGVVYCAVVGLFAGIFFPFLERLFNVAAALLVDVMVCLTGFFARLPLGHIETPPWPMAAVGAWYAGVLLLAFLLHVAAGRSLEEGARQKP